MTFKIKPKLKTKSNVFSVKCIRTTEMHLKKHTYC